MSAKHRLLLVSPLVMLLDQLSKYWLIEIYRLPEKAPVALCPNFSLVMAWNRGVSFSMFAHSAAWMPWALIALALAISALLVRLALKTPDRWEQLGYALVIGGAMGNAVDRVRFGAVADFFYAHIGDLGWPAFNVADSAICAGVGLLLLRMVKRPSAP